MNFTEIVTSDIFEMVMRIMNLFGIIVAVIFFIKTKIVFEVKQRKNEKQNQIIATNKENQKEKEEELKPMAIGLCDKCGIEVPVREFVFVDDFDLCEKCAEIVTKNKEELMKAENEFIIAKEKLERARSRYNPLYNSNKITEEEPEEEKNENELTQENLFGG